MTFAINERNYNCPLELTLSIIGGKWKILILVLLRRRTKRYGELRSDIPDITHKMLAQQLRELERDGMIHRRAFPEVPPRVEYSLTAEGERLIPVLLQMADWGMRYHTGDPADLPASSGGDAAT
ncbi:MAG: transcriptional regulator [Chlorobi bacterium]|nr:transcriptional regulator [Chlorobiota bacterium]